jgi:hypothetical protein
VCVGTLVSLRRRGLGGGSGTEGFGMGVLGVRVGVAFLLFAAFS